MRVLSILVVDDEPLNREVAQAILAGAGHRVTSCANGQEALRLCHAPDRQFDAVLMDIRMPVMDGLTATRALKSAGDTQAMPVIVMSGSVYGTDEQEVRSVGGDAFLRKPFRRLDLLRLLASVLVSRGVLTEAEASS